MELAHERDGSGPPLVLLAGIGMNGAAWRPVRPLLAAERELTLIDMPGFGNSSALPDDTDSTIDALTDAVERCLPKLGLEQPHVAGNSLGGAVGLELARRGAVASVTAISPAGFWSGPGGRFAHRSLRASYAATELLRPLAPRLLARPRLRRLLFGQMFAHAERMTPAEAVAHMDMLRTATASTRRCRTPAATSSRPATCRCRPRSHGARATRCCCRRRRGARAGGCRTPTTSGCAAAATCR
jgi:pimeloyl-ACP methyl ester carboxylesterase